MFNCSMKCNVRVIIFIFSVQFQSGLYTYSKQTQSKQNYWGEPDQLVSKLCLLYCHIIIMQYIVRVNGNICVRVSYFFFLFINLILLSVFFSVSWSFAPIKGHFYNVPFQILQMTDFDSWNQNKTLQENIYSINYANKKK